jgi:polyisoprenoid-binding protein YceI
MHGVTKNIVLPFEILGRMTDPQGKTRIGIEAHMKLDRKDYGLKWNRTLDKGGVAVGNEVNIEILLELISK